MNWFKKSIAYDQRRKLLVFPILIIISNILNIIFAREQILSSEIGKGPLNIIYGDSVYVVNLFLVALTALISFGFREISERNYVPSMPMKKRDIVLTKYSCAMTFSIFPLIIGFIMESVLYAANKKYLSQEGYFYSNILIRNINILLISMILVSLIFFIGHLYSNIKVAAVLSILGSISFIHILYSVHDIFSYNSIIKNAIENTGGFIFNAMFYPVGHDYLYSQDILGIILFLVGVVVLLYFLIDLIVSKFTNDFYDSLHPFKISKIITLTILTMVMMSIAIIVSGIAFDVFYIQPMDRNWFEGMAVPEEKNNPWELLEKVEVISAAVLLPLWIFLSRKINKKLEERF